MNIYKIIINLLVAVLLMDSISFAMNDDCDKHLAAFGETTEQRKSSLRAVPASFIDDLLNISSDYVKREDFDESKSIFDKSKDIIIALVSKIDSIYEDNARTRELSDRYEKFDNTVCIYTQEQFDALSAIYASLMGMDDNESSSVASISLDHTFELDETAEQIKPSLMISVPAGFINGLLEVSNGYVEQEDLDELESTSDQAIQIVKYLVYRINALYKNNAHSNTVCTHTQEQVDAVMALIMPLVNSPAAKVSS